MVSDALPLNRPRRLGTSSSVYPLAYGCWRFGGTDVRTAREKIETAIEVGINLFDHADVYGDAGGAEELFGRVLSEAPHLRAAILLATKGGIVPGVPYDASPAHIRRAAEASLRRLRVDVIDLYQIHRPDLLAHPEEVAAVLIELRRDGKVREVGVSNYTAAQCEALQSFLPFPIATHQPELSAWCLDPLRDGVLDQCLQRRMTPLAWSPLAGGRLGLDPDRARQQREGERLVAVIECLDALSAAQQLSRTAIALAFLLAHPAGVVPIIGTQRLERIRDCGTAVRAQLTRADWYRVVSASQGAPLP